MFTGIIQAIGRIAAIESGEEDIRLRIDTGKLPLSEVKLGDSIATSGVCLTVTELPGDGFWADVSPETLSLTSLGTKDVGDSVNLETSLTLQTALGGHLVSGHVDGLATLIESEASARSTRMRFAGSREVAVYIAEKGSVTLDGVSLTVNGVTDSQAAVMFDVNLVPHTLGVTTLGRLATEDRVHLEVDMVARYLQRMQDCR